jgi:predicted Zn-dependent peptidase
MKTNIYKLKNGIRVVIVPVEGLNSVTTEVFFKIGSKYETKSEFGISHFLEHMAFKGTKKRPLASDINKEIDSKGAGYNAGTGHEMTSYYITTTQENIAWALELLSDMLINSIFDKDEVLKERGVIMEEIRMYQDNPMMGLPGELTKFLYSKSNIGCWDIAGDVEDIENVTRDKVVGYRNKLINPDNIVVVLAGNVDSTAFSEAEKYFSEFSVGIGNVLPKVEIILNNEKRKEIIRPVEQGHFAMAVPGIARNDRRKYAFRILDLVLNGNSSSRLYQKIREDNGLAYYVESVGESFVEAGYWGVQSGVKMNRLDEAMDMVRNELVEIQDNLKEDEVQRAKDYLVGKTKLAMDRTGYLAGLVGEKLLLDGEIINLEEELENYKKVTMMEVLDLTKNIFNMSEIREIVIKNK